MKYLKKYKLFESVNEEYINDTCKKYGIENYTINSDGSIDVEGSVDFYNQGLTKLPIKFRNVSGNFICDHNNLTSLKGAPKSVGGRFDCYNNKLTSLEGAPSGVGSNFDCHSNKLSSLEGAPSQVGRGFYCEGNNLTSLKGAPSSVGDDFHCHDNNLTTLEGAPNSVGGNFYCDNNKLTSLKGAPKSVGVGFSCYNNQLTSLKGLEWKSFERINLSDNPIYKLVKDWINNKDREDLIEYFIDMNIIQEGEDKPKLILPRLEAFYEDMNLQIDINLEEVKKYYEIIQV